MRCPDCNKFVSFDTEQDPELNLDFDDEGRITGDARIVNACAECSTELKEHTFDVDSEDLVSVLEDHRDEVIAKLVADGMDKAEAEQQAQADHIIESIDDDGGSRTERTQDKDRNGKPIKRARYAKHFYGFEATVTATCKCGEQFTTTVADEVQGSGMEEMV